MSLYNDWPFSLSKVPSIKSYTSTPHHPQIIQRTGTIHKTTTKQQSKFWNVLVIVVDVLEKMTFFGENSQHSNSTNPKCSHPFLTTLTHSTPANSDPNFSPPPRKKNIPKLKQQEIPEKKTLKVQRCRRNQPVRVFPQKLRRQTTSNLLQLGDFGVQVRVLLLHLLHLAEDTESGPNVVCFFHFGLKHNEEKQKNVKKKKEEGE